MNESDKLLAELKDIREIMQRSSKFLSLSGLSGILVGIYALLAAFIAYPLTQMKMPAQNQTEFINELLSHLIPIAGILLLVSLLTIFLLTIKQAKKEQKPIWGPGSKLLLLNLLIPLATGAILTTIFIFRGYYEIISPALLIFYGLALVNAAKYTRPEILGLGIAEILLGLIAAIFPAYGLYLWAVGFGVIHIIYGAIFLRNESKQKV
jgi:hypothetical protein